MDEANPGDEDEDDEWLPDIDKEKHAAFYGAVLGYGIGWLIYGQKGAALGAFSLGYAGSYIGRKMMYRQYEKRMEKINNRP